MVQYSCSAVYPERDPTGAESFPKSGPKTATPTLKTYYYKPQATVGYSSGVQAADAFFGLGALPARQRIETLRRSLHQPEPS
ncbi:MAG TPA: hypothetical protein VE868_00495 [Balneolaceae bacterium]|nr:hypothetical protein [Balneolaceae bacterium]